MATSGVGPPPTLLSRPLPRPLVGQHTRTFLQQGGRLAVPELEHGACVGGGTAAGVRARPPAERKKKKRNALPQPSLHRPPLEAARRHAHESSEKNGSARRLCCTHTHAHAQPTQRSTQLSLLSPPSPVPYPPLLFPLSLSPLFRLRSGLPPRPPPPRPPRCASSPAAAGPSSRRPAGSWRQSRPGRW